jgi:hypothetical protein
MAAAVTFKPGDAVIVIAVPGIRYPEACLPGTMSTVVRECSCRCAFRGMTSIPFYVLAVGVCALEVVLKKIDPDGRQLVDWDWRELTKENPQVAVPADSHPLPCTV